MSEVRADVEGTNEEGLCYREEDIWFHGYESVLSVDMQKALEKSVEYGSTKIEIEIRGSASTIQDST